MTNAPPQMKTLYYAKEGECTTWGSQLQGKAEVLGSGAFPFKGAGLRTAGALGSRGLGRAGKSFNQKGRRTIDYGERVVCFLHLVRSVILHRHAWPRLFILTK